MASVGVSSVGAGAIQGSALGCCKGRCCAAPARNLRKGCECAELDRFCLPPPANVSPGLRNLMYDLEGLVKRRKRLSRLLKLREELAAQEEVAAQEDLAAQQAEGAPPELPWVFLATSKCRLAPQCTTPCWPGACEGLVP